MRIIAIDYGQKRCGIAITDPLQLVASPHSTIDTHTLKQFLKQYITTSEVESIVIGMPLRLNGEENPICKEIENLITKLKELFPNKKIYSFDERFTSKIAQQSILMSGAKKKTRQDKRLVDMVSASVLLQDFLTYKSNFNL